MTQRCWFLYMGKCDSRALCHSRALTNIQHITIALPGQALMRAHAHGLVPRPHPQYSELTAVTCVNPACCAV